MKQLFSSTLLLVVWASTAAALSPQDKACMKLASSCGSCTEQGNHCGWCNDTQSCLSGYDAFGPVTCKNWVPYEGSCSDPCQGATSCSNCVDQTWDCGYCQGSATCMQGNATAPKNQQCPGGWSFGRSARSCSHCQHLYRECDTCMADPACGWCPSQGPNGGCFSGNSTGPFYANDNTCSRWYYQNLSACPASQQSPAPGSVCQAHTDCGSCLADNKNGQCGWCASKNKCFSGDAEGPDGSSCDYRWHWDQCPSNCSRHTNCGDCSGDMTGECGWCMVTQTCQNGTSSGPYDGTCNVPYWQFGSYACPGCGGATPGSCNSCLQISEDVGGCGYCGTTKMCYEGSPSGPFNGSCPIGNWTYDDNFCPDDDEAAPKHNLNRELKKDRVLSCSALTSCDACTAAAGLRCGWCAAQGTCQSGTRTGPSKKRGQESCSTDKWAFFSTQC